MNELEPACAAAAPQRKEVMEFMKNLKNLGKRGLALGLSLMMCAALLPGTAFAADVEEHDHDHVHADVEVQAAAAVGNIGSIGGGSIGNIGGGLTPVDPDINVDIGGGTGTGSGSISIPVKPVDPGVSLWPKCPYCGMRLRGGESNKSATCTEPGISVYFVCDAGPASCGRYFNGSNREIKYGDWIIPPLGHQAGSAVRENVVEATETEDGSYDVVHYCSRRGCGVELDRETVIVPAHVHTAGEVVIENNKDATCIAAGQHDEVTYCTGANCDKEMSRETVIVDALGGHDWSAFNWYWTEKNGVYTSSRVSLKCLNSPKGNEYSYHTIPLNASETWVSYESTFTGELTVSTVEATCGTDAVTIYTAVVTVDGKTFSDSKTVTDVGSATGEHTWSDAWSSDGTSHWHECTVCGAKSDEAEHTASEAWSADGENHWHVCEVCGQNVDVEGHTPAEPVREKWVSAGLIREGSYDMVVYCSVCGEELSREHTVIPATGSASAGDASESPAVPENPDIEDVEEIEIEIDETVTPLAPGPVTRGEFVDYLWRYAGQPGVTATTTFSDVAAGSEYSDAISWVQFIGLVQGFGDDTFRPGDVLTVFQVRTILTRFAKWLGMPMPELTTLTGEDSDPVLNCEEVLIEFFDAVKEFMQVKA